MTARSFGSFVLFGIWCEIFWARGLFKEGWAQPFYEPCLTSLVTVVLWMAGLFDGWFTNITITSMHSLLLWEEEQKITFLNLLIEASNAFIPEYLTQLQTQNNILCKILSQQAGGWSTV